MAAFIIKIMNYVAGELITKRLARSKTFQDLAVRTHDKIQAVKGIVEDPRQAEQTLKEAEKILRSGRGQVDDTATSVGARFRRFQAALKEEIERDLGRGKGKTK
ncbi:unnamed protein product [Choristocarpus tenellus]